MSPPNIGAAAVVGVLLIAAFIWGIANDDNESTSTSSAGTTSTPTSTPTSTSDQTSGSGDSEQGSPTPDPTHEAFEDISAGDCLDELRVGDCFLGKKSEKGDGRISITNHGLMTSWGCGKSTVPTKFDYILRVTELTSGSCPTGSRTWDLRGGNLCARVA